MSFRQLAGRVMSSEAVRIGLEKRIMSLPSRVVASLKASIGDVVFGMEDGTGAAPSTAPAARQSRVLQAQT